MLQRGQPSDVTAILNVEDGTTANLITLKQGQPESTIRAQHEHNENGLGASIADPRNLIIAWPRLPIHVQQTILELAAKFAEDQ